MIKAPNLQWIGTCTYAVLLVFSVLFFVERVGFMDLSFHLFSIIKDGEFAIQNNRFVAFFTQLFPLLSSKAGLSLSVVMKLYSASFIILNFTCFIILAFVLKSWRYGVIMVLLNVLMVTHTFFWAQSELQQGLPILIIYFGLIEYYLKLEERDIKYYVLQGFMQVLLLVLVFAHPVIFIPAVFLYVFYMYRDSINRKYYGMNMGVFIALLGIKTIFFSTAYDTQAGGSALNLLTFFPNYFTHQSNYNFVRYVINDYYFLIIGAIAIGLFYMRSKRWFELLLSGGFFIAYLLLVNLSYPGGEHQFYLENLYLPLTIFVAFPLVYDLMPKLKMSYAAYALILVVTIRLADIYYTHNFYEERVDYLYGLIDEVQAGDNTKVLLKEREADKEALMMTWAVPYEVWVLSTYRDQQSSSIILTENVNEKSYIQQYSTKFSATWGDFEYNSLPEPYFVFKDYSNYVIRQ